MAQRSTTSQLRLERLAQALGSGTFADVKRMLNGLPAADVAHLLESSPPKFRHILWQMVELENEGDVINELGDELRVQFLSDMDAAGVVQITEQLQDDDLAEILQQLPDRVTREVLDSMDHRDRARLEQVTTYPDDTAGGLMSTDTITIRPPLTLDVVLRYLRRHDQIPAMTDNLFVVNRSDQFIGLLSLNTLLVSDPNATVREMMITDIAPIPAWMPDEEVARLFERNDWVSAPVVDDGGRLLGRITIDDVVDVIREDTDHSLTSMAGLSEDTDTFAPVLHAASPRGIWLGINLVTAAFTGAALPLLLKRMKIDPALAGGVVLTTVTDVVGFSSFLGLATWFYA